MERGQFGFIRYVKMERVRNAVDGANGVMSDGKKIYQAH